MVAWGFLSIKKALCLQQKVAENRGLGLGLDFIWVI